MSDDIKEGDSFQDPDKLYFTKQHLKEALKDFRDKFHHEAAQPDGQEISRSEAGIFTKICIIKGRRQKCYE